MMRHATLYEILGCKEYKHRNRNKTLECCGQSLLIGYMPFDTALIMLLSMVLTSKASFAKFCERIRERNGWDDDCDIVLGYQFDGTKSVEVTAKNSTGERRVTIDLTRGGEIG